MTLRITLLPQTVHCMLTTATCPSLQTISLGFVFLSSLCVALTWQFAQFIFLLEGVALFTVQLLGVTPTPKVGGYSCLNRVIVHNDDIISTGYPYSIHPDQLHQECPHINVIVNFSS